MGELIPIASIDEVEEGEMEEFDVDGEEILLCNIDNSFHAVSGICTHAYAELIDGELDGYNLTCPVHFACFDVRSGCPISPPAKESLKVYDVVIKEGRVFIKV